MRGYDAVRGAALLWRFGGTHFQDLRPIIRSRWIRRGGSDGFEVFLLGGGCGVM